MATSNDRSDCGRYSGLNPAMTGSSQWSPGVRQGRLLCRWALLQGGEGWSRSGQGGTRLSVAQSAKTGCETTSRVAFRLLSWDWIKKPILVPGYFAFINVELGRDLIGTTIDPLNNVRHKL